MGVSYSVGVFIFPLANCGASVSIPGVTQIKPENIQSAAPRICDSVSRLFHTLGLLTVCFLLVQ
jgi:hypothetical protein